MAKEKSLLVPVIAIAAIAGAFRRCGHAFGKEPQHFAQDYFTEEQGTVLMNEKKLSLRTAVVDPAEVHVIGLEVAEEQDAKQDDTGKPPEGSPNAGGSDNGETMLIGSSVQPAEIEIVDGMIIQLGKLVGFAQEQSGLDIKDWNAQPDEDRESKIAGALSLLLAVATAAAEAGGKSPAVNAVSKAMGGGKVSADERDAALALLVSLKGPEGNT